MQSARCMHIMGPDQALQARIKLQLALVAVCRSVCHCTLMSCPCWCLPPGFVLPFVNMLKSACAYSDGTDGQELRRRLLLLGRDSSTNSTAATRKTPGAANSNIVIAQGSSTGNANRINDVLFLLWAQITQFQSYNDTAVTIEKGTGVAVFACIIIVC